MDAILGSVLEQQALVTALIDSRCRAGRRESGASQDFDRTLGSIPVHPQGGEERRDGRRRGREREGEVDRLAARAGLIGNR